MVTLRRLFENETVYHVFNRGVEKRVTFLEKKDYHRFLETVAYYQFDQALPFSRYFDLASKNKLEGQQVSGLKTVGKRISILAYCLMTNHFHFLMKQEKEEGLSTFISDVCDSYTRFFNIKYERLGNLFQGTFKAKSVRDESSLLQVSRYIHLNPIISSKSFRRNNLASYPYSSYSKWLTLNDDALVSVKEVTRFLKLVGKDYRDFVESKVPIGNDEDVRDLMIDG